MPNQPATPHISVRVKKELKEQVLRVAADRGETMTDVVIRALERYVREHPLNED